MRRQPSHLFRLPVGRALHRAQGNARKAQPPPSGFPPIGRMRKTHLPQPSLSVAEGEVGVIKEGPLEERAEAE